jgi:hypothetical protein
LRTAPTRASAISTRVLCGTDSRRAAHMRARRPSRQRRVAPWQRPASHFLGWITFTHVGRAIRPPATPTSMPTRLERRPRSSWMRAPFAKPRKYPLAREARRSGIGMSRTAVAVHDALAPSRAARVLLRGVRQAAGASGSESLLDDRGRRGAARLQAAGICAARVPAAWISAARVPAAWISTARVSTAWVPTAWISAARVPAARVSLTALRRRGTAAACR